MEIRPDYVQGLCGNAAEAPSQRKQGEANQSIVGHQLQIFIVRVARHNSCAPKTLAVFGEGIAVVARAEANQRRLLDHIDRIHPGLRPEIAWSMSDTGSALDNCLTISECDRATFRLINVLIKKTRARAFT